MDWFPPRLLACPVGVHFVMNKTIKGIIIWTIAIIGSSILLFLGYFYYMFPFGCGMDDGPFEAKLIAPIEYSDSAFVIDLSENAQILIENRTDTLSPVIILLVQDEIKWTLDTDTRNTPGYENTRIWELDHIEITDSTDPIRLTFYANWTYGFERGSMNIDKTDGGNQFCLSW